MRQQEQGFIEPKQGYLSPQLSFKIASQQSGKYALKIIHGYVEYKKVPTEDQETNEYDPFHALVYGLTTIIGDEGTARVSYPRNDLKETWALAAPEPLDDAIEKYRYSEFQYNSNGIELSFISEPFQEKTHGELTITFPFSDIADLKSSIINEVIKVFEHI
jgi:hypothetical protein